MNNTTLSNDQLSHNISQDLHNCVELLRLLEDERNALGQRDAQKLEEIIKAKSAHLQNLESNASQRTLWLKDSATEPATESLQTQWDTLLQGRAPELKARWQQFKTLLNQCQNENEINGRLLARNQQVFARLLSILRGQGDNQNVYSAKGNKPSGGGRQSLGEA